jgi:hypothetical protein
MHAGRRARDDEGRDWAMLLQAEEHQRLLATTGGQDRSMSRLPLTALRGSRPS